MTGKPRGWLYSVGVAGWNSDNILIVIHWARRCHNLIDQILTANKQSPSLGDKHVKAARGDQD